MSGLRQPPSYHAFSLRGRSYLLDVESSFLYATSPAAHREIVGDPARKERPLIERLGAKMEWAGLKRRLRPLSEKERRAEQERIERSRPELAGLWLGIAHACNLACEYCFANEPAYLGRRKLMDVDTALRGIDFLVENARAEGDLAVTFFGGEPLLNLDLIDRVVEYCRELETADKGRFSFALTTNGVLLTRDVFEKLKGYGIYPLISMDGTRAAHDRYRKTHDGRPTWDRIVDNLRSIPDFQNYLAVRATIVEDDADLVEALETLREVGFSSIKLAGLCPNSGIEKGGTGNFRLDVWKKRYLELVDHTLAAAKTIEDIPERGMRFDVYALKERRRAYFCCATGRHYYYLDPEGDLYPCFRLMTPDGGEKVGHLGDVLDADRASRFFQTNVLATDCYNCWARYMCGGPCFGDAFHTSGDYSTPDAVQCEQRKFMIECGAYLLDRLAKPEAKGDGSV